MKKLCLLLSLTFFSFLKSEGQTIEKHYFKSEDYAKLKSIGQLPLGNVIELADSSFATSAMTDFEKGALKSASCGCYVLPDASYTLAMSPCDDCSSPIITLPFNFCLYGVNYDSIYINNNGNVSFGSSYGTFSAAGFPSTSFIMVAPFWADVDTRPATAGAVKYKIYPNAIYINWEGVGYYSMMTDKKNTFQLVLSDGTDTTIGIGNNVAFCYKDMQWTTGAASAGVGGFGGVPATVGVNNGTGINYYQLGRFNQPGSAYDGPYGAYDGIDYLDYNSFTLNACGLAASSSPFVTTITPFSSVACGGYDTVFVCGLGDTLVMNANALDPDVSDTITLSVSGPGVSGFSVINTTNGNPANVTWQLVTSAANLGANTFYVSGVDNHGVITPTYSVVVIVDTTLGSVTLSSVSGDTAFCTGDSIQLSIPFIYDSYAWTTGSITASSGYITEGGVYSVTITDNFCTQSFSQFVVENSVNIPLTGLPNVCMGPTTFSSSGFINYTWEFNGSPWSVNDTTTFTGPGSITLSVVDSLGCSGDTSFFIFDNPVINFGPNTVLCHTDSLLINPFIGTAGSYSWSTGDTGSTVWVYSPGIYTLTFTQNIYCSVTDSIEIYAVDSSSTFVASCGFPVTLCVPLTAPLAGTLDWQELSTGFIGNDTCVVVSSDGIYMANQLYINGCTNVNTYTVTDTCSLSVFQHSILDNSVVVYPNPSADFILVSSDKTIEEITVYTYSSQLIYSAKQVDAKKTQVDCRSLSDGVYLMKAKIENAFYYSKITVIH